MLSKGVPKKHETCMKKRINNDRFLGCKNFLKLCPVPKNHGSPPRCKTVVLWREIKITPPPPPLQNRGFVARTGIANRGYCGEKGGSLHLFLADKKFGFPGETGGGTVPPLPPPQNRGFVARQGGGLSPPLCDRMLRLGGEMSGGDGRIILARLRAARPYYSMRFARHYHGET